MTDNVVGIKGEAATDLERLEEINGTRQQCWRLVVITKRKSGYADEVIVYATDKTQEGELLPFIKGESVLVTGKMQTVKNFKTGQVLTYVLADFIGLLPRNVEHENGVQITGEIAKGTSFRETPKGKRVTSFMVEVKSELRQNSCYIPCIAWGSVADEVKNWQRGTRVELNGRLQSRDYIKVTPEGDIKRTSHEVSANTIQKIEENEEQTPTE